MSDIRTKPSTAAYRDGWERIYGKKKEMRLVGEKSWSKMSHKERLRACIRAVTMRFKWE